MSAIPVPFHLGPHGIFNTYYKEITLSFANALQTTPYNTAEDTGRGPTSGLGMYYIPIYFKVSSLKNSDLGVHFDLYNSVPQTGNTANLQITDFAPFSHDAEGWKQVPEPSVILLLGTGLLGLAAYGRKRNRK